MLLIKRTPVTVTILPIIYLHIDISILDTLQIADQEMADHRII